MPVSLVVPIIDAEESENNVYGDKTKNGWMAEESGTGIKNESSDPWYDLF